MKVIRFDLETAESIMHNIETGSWVIDRVVMADEIGCVGMVKYMIVNTPNGKKAFVCPQEREEKLRRLAR